MVVLRHVEQVASGAANHSANTWHGWKQTLRAIANLLSGTLETSWLNKKALHPECKGDIHQDQYKQAFVVADQHLD